MTTIDRTYGPHSQHNYLRSELPRPTVKQCFLISVFNGFDTFSDGFGTISDRFRIVSAGRLAGRWPGRSAGRPGGARVVRGEKKIAGGPGGDSPWAKPVKGGVWGGEAPPTQIRGVWGAAPPSAKTEIFFGKFRKNLKLRKIRTVLN